MAAPAFRAVTAKAAAADSAAPGLPAGVAAGDIVLLVVAVLEGRTAAIDAAGSISTWTLINTGGTDVVGGSKLFVWWGRYVSGSTGPTVSDTATGDYIVAATVAYSGVPNDPNFDPILAFASSSETTSDTSYSFATGVSTPRNNCLVINIYTSGVDSNTGQGGTTANTSLTSVNLRAEYETNTGGGGGFVLADGVKATAGTCGTWTDTMVSATPKSYISFALPGGFARAVAADGAGGIAVAATFFSILERTVATGATAIIETSGVVVPGFTEHERAVAVDAAGAIASSGEFFSVFERALLTNATADVATVGDIDYHRSVAVSATAGIAVSGHGILERATTTSATAGIATSAQFFTTFERSLTADAVGAVTVTRQVDFLRSIGVSATADITSNGHKVGPEHERSASISATAAIETSSQFWTTFERVVGISATAAITVNAQRSLNRSVTLTATASIGTDGGVPVVLLISGIQFIGTENRTATVSNGGRMQLANGQHGTVLTVGSETHVF